VGGVDVPLAGPVHDPGIRARFTTSNVDEALPGVLAPLTWSFYLGPTDHGARTAWHGLGALGRRELATPDDVDQRFFTAVLGHAASNVELFGRMADRMPGGSAAKMELQLFGSVDRGRIPERLRRGRYPVIVAKAPFTLRRAMRALPTLARDIECWWSTNTGGAGGVDPAALLGQARDRLDAFLGTHMVLTMACQGVLERVAKIAESAGLPGLEHDLVRSDAGTEEFALVADLWAMAAGSMRMDGFLARHGYHGPGEGQLDAVVWREDPTPVTHLVEAYRQREGESTAALVARRRAEHAAACARLESALGPARAVLARRIVRFASHAPVWRETGRATILRCVDVARYAARSHGRELAARGDLDAAEDVFLLTVDEIVHGTAADPRSLVALRRRQRDVYAGAVLPQVWRGVPEPGPGRPGGGGTGGESTVAGLGVSSGVGEGVVRVVLDQRDADLDEGSVLVCRATDPGWASLFPLARAVVTDVGSSMSHAAIVCRELGLPCVANTRDGTSRLRDGMRVRVDGSSGVVEILEEPP
jgi:pyruvate,water dikinase